MYSDLVTKADIELMAAPMPANYRSPKPHPYCPIEAKKRKAAIRLGRDAATPTRGKATKNLPFDLDKQAMAAAINAEYDQKDADARKESAGEGTRNALKAHRTKALIAAGIAVPITAQRLYTPEERSAAALRGHASRVANGKVYQRAEKPAKVYLTPEQLTAARKQGFQTRLANMKARGESFQHTPIPKNRFNKRSD